MNPYNPTSQTAYPGPAGPLQPNPYQAPGSSAPAGGTYSAMYEFDAAQNRVLGQTASWTLALGIVLVVQGAFQLVQLAIFGALANGAMGVMLILASNALRKVVSTQGQDVPYLMKALSNFGNMLLFRSILFLLAILFIGTVVALVVLAKLAGS